MSKSSEHTRAASIAETIADYRHGAVPEPDAKHVLKWAEQLEPESRCAVLTELDAILKKTYFSRPRVVEFLGTVAGYDKLTSKDPSGFWKNARLLDIQQRGTSQHEFNAVLKEVVFDQVGVAAQVGRSGSGTFIYLDDVVFTGNHVRRDLEAWVADDAPDKADVHVILIGLHEGSWYHRGELDKAIKQSGKSITLQWWRCLQLEDRKKYINQSDVLRPRSLPDVGEVAEYIKSLEYPVQFRSADSVGSAKLFSGEAGRHALEQALLIAGVRVRDECPALPVHQRPLGYHSLDMLGFGSMLVTYRNCPNNAPLALWAGSPWYPLFPRRIN